ncbi:tuftelin-like isoform X3 [Molothrus ater]|uniref:tuftelin-like isoform X3 n=1 Tax=Molothrus ater TaxID=84834 RepID=UPI0017495748|nr:tuftelin-like isoform X3 [Molothrus ater]
MEFLEFWEFQEVQESSEVVLEKRNQSCSCQGNSQDNPEDPKALRLLWRLQEAEKWHQLERSGLERALLWCQEDAERADSARSRAETEVEQLQRLLAGMEKDHRHLLVRMELGQADLERLRKAERERAAQQEWWEFKNGNSLQNSKSVIQAKDAAIQELKERVSYLEAENLEMHDQIEHLIEKQVSRGRSSARTRSKSEYVSSKCVPGPKPLPLIRVVET